MVKSHKYLENEVKIQRLEDMFEEFQRTEDAKYQNVKADLLKLKDMSDALRVKREEQSQAHYERTNSLQNEIQSMINQLSMVSSKG